MRATGRREAPRRRHRVAAVIVRNCPTRDARRKLVGGFRDGFKADAISKNRFTADGLKESLRDFSVAQTAKLKAARNTIAKARDRLAELEKETALPLPGVPQARQGAGALRPAVAVARASGPET